MLSLLLILSGLGCLTSAGPNSQRPLLEITVPQKSTNASDGSETQITYFIRIKEKTYNLFLEKQSFLHPHFMIYSYNKEGTLQKNFSPIKGHCFYQGHAANIPKSVVTLNICSGLRGLLQLENVSYGIEPLESSSIFEHMVYQINSQNDYSPSKENHHSLQNIDQSYRILVKSEKKSDVEQLKRTLKIHIILDKTMFHYMGSEIGIVAKKVVHIVGLINTMFSQLKMTIMLSSLEVWSDKNKISTNGDADEVLQRFLLWKQKVLFQRSKDMVYLLIYREHPDFVGATYHGVACDPKLAAGIVLHPNTITLETFSVVMTQLIGINLGLAYDDIYKCDCPGKTCIMNPEAIYSRGIKLFSSCSIDGFWNMVSQPAFQCLHNQTISKEPYLKQSGPVCGNGNVEGNEECDCGNIEQCTYRRCCHPNNCTITSDNIECSNGPCCNNLTCMYYERGYLCRKSRNPCDFAEYCNGTSAYCGPDMRAANMQTCNNRTAYCVDGKCRDARSMCQRFFGKFSNQPPYRCVEEINFQNDDFGNCRGQRCSAENIFCGKLICSLLTTKLVYVRHYDIQYTYIDGHVCFSTRYQVNHSRSDRSFTPDGFSCGEDKVCNRGTCVLAHLHRLREPCNSTEKCHGHGICNNRFNCHCDAGYAPPACEEAPFSPGGSIDDGFWVSGARDKLWFESQRHVAHQKRGLLVSFYIFLHFLILTTIVVLKWKKIKGVWHKEGSVNEQSVSEDSNYNSTMS